jgi:hypothetical protein
VQSAPMGDINGQKASFIFLHTAQVLSLKFQPGTDQRWASRQQPTDWMCCWQLLQGPRCQQTSVRPHWVHLAPLFTCTMPPMSCAKGLLAVFTWYSLKLPATHHNTTADGNTYQGTCNHVCLDKSRYACIHQVTPYKVLNIWH